MDGRSTISLKDVNRLISTRILRDREQKNQIYNCLSGNETELLPTFSLIKVDFNKDSRITKLEFLQAQQYKTIERYITRNYVRYPIYSGWKKRTKIIKKTIKLTNRELENLETNEDELISQFANQIVLSLNDVELLPSWYIKLAYLEEHFENFERLNSQLEEFTASCNKNIAASSQIIKNNKTILDQEKIKLAKITKKFNKTSKKFNKITASKKTAIKYIFTFGIYAYITSNTRKQKYLNKLSSQKRIIETITENINKISNENNEMQNDITNLKKKIEDKKSETTSLINKSLYICGKKQKAITPLPEIVKIDDSFITLKSICGIEQKKIIGCYIIRNKLNNKHYVGQSKDVIRRLKQHFKGTVPNNVIFAEDYYCTPIENRNDLFEVKIISCSTKDELDKTEKQLIEKYDSFNSGYNGTNGNT